MVHVTDRFDSGNIEVLEQNPEDLQLAIRPDEGAEHYQWFHFRVTGARGRRLAWRITNAKGASYEGGWPGYQACASYDREHWFRVPTRYEDGELRVTHQVTADAVWYAYFAPYSLERHQRLIGRSQGAEGVRLEVLGETLDGRPLDMLTVGEPAEGKRPFWILARQHPGETQAEWWMEGALEVLTDPADSVGRELRKRCRLHIVPNCNPDGSKRGNLRVNAAGTNLNREWAEPTAEKSPEVLAIRNRMDETGVDFAMDVHGDEAIPVSFLAGYEGIPGWTEEQGNRYYRYEAILDRRTPDFQTEQGYTKAAPGKANLSMSTNQVAERFGATAMTLEMPYKDNPASPEPEQGWSPERCKLLARDCLAALLEYLDTPDA